MESELNEPTSGIVVKWRVEMSPRALALFPGEPAEKYRLIREWCDGKKLRCSRPDPTRYDLVETHTRQEAQEIFEGLSLYYDFQARPPFRITLNMAEIEAEKIEQWKETRMYGEDKNEVEKARKSLRRRNIEPPMRTKKKGE